MAIWQFDALVHASYTAKLPGPVPQGELTLNAIEHFPWAVVSHAIAGAAVVGVAGEAEAATRTQAHPADVSRHARPSTPEGSPGYA
jgi:hypothetical protein